MSHHLIDYAIAFSNGVITAKEFSDHFMVRWKQERDSGEILLDADSVSECLSTIFCLADLFNPELNRNEYELDSVLLRTEVSKLLSSLGKEGLTKHRGQINSKESGRLFQRGSQPMDEQAFLRILRAEPDNDEVRFAYWNWLEETGDARAPYVRQMRERLRLLEELKETDALLRAHEPQIDDAWIDMAFPMRVRSPMVGRCYIKPSPDAQTFVEVGSQVTPDTVVCLIEAMKLFNEITAGVHGVVSEVAVTNAASVEYNQVLFRVSRPSLDFW